MGQTVVAVEKTVVGIMGFVLFFVFWVIIFSFLQRIIGRDVDPTDTRYKNVSEQIRFLLHSWIFSTGGGAV